MMIELKKIEEIGDFKKLLDIQKSAWGFSDLDTEPHHLMTRVQKYGGLVYGLFTHGELAGFTYAIIGKWKGEYFIYSHMTGVKKEYQSSGFGFLLKKAQRQEVLKMGYDVMRWNFDPLESMNAYFNFHRLGVVGTEYERNIYGEGESGLHKGLSTDRLIVTWNLKSERVVKKMKKKELLIIDVISSEKLEKFTQETAYIELPENIRLLKQTHLDQAIEWRMKTRRLFESAFNKGYVARDIVFSKDEKKIFYNKEIKGSMKRIRKIDSMELFIVRIPLVTPFETSFSVQTHREALLLKITSDDFSGWGECITSPDPYYSYETNSTSIHIIKKFLATILKTLKNFSIHEVLLKFERIRGHYMAKAAVENTLLDLIARKFEIPLFELIGGKSIKIMSGISIGIMENMDDLLKSIKHACDKRYHRIKIKIKKGKDIKILKSVRKTFPDIHLMADANGDYSHDDLHILKRLDEFHLMMIEQPLCYDDIYYHSLLQQQINTPICLDESIKNLNDAKTAQALGSCRIINIKQGRVGGMIKSKKIQEFCLNNSIKVWSGGMLETGIGRAFNIHLQTLPGFVLPGDTSETSRYFNEDIVDKPVVLEPDGFITIPRGTGIGVEVVPKKLDRFKVFHEKIV